MRDRARAFAISSDVLYGVAAVTAGRIYLVRGIPLLSDGSAGLTFARYDRDGNVATTDLATKRVQVSLNVVRSQSSVASTTDTAVSAIFVLRNKPTT